MLILAAVGVTSGARRRTIADGDNMVLALQWLVLCGLKRLYSRSGRCFHVCDDNLERYLQMFWPQTAPATGGSTLAFYFENPFFHSLKFLLFLWNRC
ncbi:hypothetical protein QL285_020181 [Trifolium repens]|nr:hypothetical protein QL285_020181 [Trifolium repens]